MRITRRSIEDLARKAPPEALTVLWDDKMFGFGVRHSPRGRITFFAKFRVRGEATQKTVTLGTHPAMHADDAREAASDLLSAAMRRRDLQAERAAAAAAAAADARRDAGRAIPLSTFLDGWRAKMEAAKAERIAAGGTGGHEHQLLRLERVELRPAIGADTVGSFDPAVLHSLVKSQRPSQARYLRTLISHVGLHLEEALAPLKLTIAWPEKIKISAPVPRREHRFTIGQMAQIWRAAGKLGRPGAMVRLMILTACRRGEASGAQERAFVLEDQVIGPYWLQVSITNKSRREHRIPLSDPAVALLRHLPPRETRTTPSTPWLFAGRGGKRYSAWTDLRRSLLAGAGLDTGTLHDFRRTIVSALADHGVPVEVSDKLLNHASSATMPGVIAVYQVSEFWEARRAALALWAKLLGEALDGQWGLDEPFREARLRRPPRAVAGATGGRG